jgi:hypothetical protein
MRRRLPKGSNPPQADQPDEVTLRDLETGTVTVTKHPPSR